MIIDIHNIIGHHKYKPFVSAESLIAQMDQAGVDKAVVFCYAESMDNAYIEASMKRYPERLIGLYTVNPWAENCEADLEDAISNRGFRGLRLDPVRHGYALNEHQIVYPLIDVCQKLHVPVWCYGAADVFSTPILFAPIAEKYPDVDIILGAMGFTYEHVLHHYTRRLWVWRRDYGSETYWGAKLGRALAEAGADAFWPSLTASSIAA